MFIVYKEFGRCRIPCFACDTEKEAQDFCDHFGWELKDEYDFMWDLDYEEDDRELRTTANAEDALGRSDPEEEL